jgi:hypothetical protein
MRFSLFGAPCHLTIFSEGVDAKRAQVSFFVSIGPADIVAALNTCDFISRARHPLAACDGLLQRRAPVGRI